MLSDCTGMTGGETAARTGKGEIMKFRGPDMVCDRLGDSEYEANAFREPPSFFRADTLNTQPSRPWAAGNASV